MEVNELAEVIAQVPTGVGENIRARRVAAHRSQQALADRMKALGLPWHQTTVAKAESGERPIRVDELFALAAIFEVSQLEDLLGEDLRDSLQRHNIAQRNAAYERAEARKRQEAAELGEDAVLEYERQLKEQEQIRADQVKIALDALTAIAMGPAVTGAKVAASETLRSMGRRARLGKPESDDG